MKANTVKVVLYLQLYRKFCEVFFHILTKYDILKCINLMTINLVEIGVVKSILYLWVLGAWGSVGVKALRY